MTAKIISFIAAGLLIGSTAVGVAENSTSDRTPGHRMQEKGPVKGEPGASGYAPGHMMQKKGSRNGEPGASGYAPSRSTPSTTGQGTRRRE
jgi:hypothetical protein